MKDARWRFGLSIGIALIILVLWNIGAFDRLQLIAIDLGFNWRPSPGSPSDVVVVGIDDSSLRQFGKLPWKRTRYSDAIDALHQHGASAIAFDMWFSDYASYREDKALANAAKRAGNVFWGMHISSRDKLVKPTLNMEELRKIAPETHLNVSLDSDGTLRRVPWKVSSLAESWLFMPLALAAHRKGINPKTICVEDGSVLRFGGARIPLVRASNSAETFYLDLAKRSDVDYISFADLIKDRVSPEKVQGKIVLIGQVVKGAQHADELDTPRGRKFGVIMLSEAIQQLLDGRYLRAADRWITAVMIVGFSLLSVFFFYPRRLGLGLISHVALLAAIWLAFISYMSRYGYILEPAPPTFAVSIGLFTGIVTSLRQAREELIRDQRAMDILRELGETVAATTGMPALATGKRPDVSNSFLLPAKTPHVFLQTMSTAVGATRAALFLRNPPGQEVVCVASTGNAEETIPKSIVEETNRRLIENGEPFASAAPAHDLGMEPSEIPHELLAMPLTLRGRVTGTVHLYDKYPTEVSPDLHFTANDLRLVANMAQQGMIGLENATLYEGMRDIFLSATLALANAVDAKDPYTHGHSKRVLEYSERIAQAMDLPERDVEIIRMAAVLHDIGKIAIPDAILRKPAKLTEEEFDIIRTHPARGVDILEPLVELQPLIPGIRNHHERYDGAGYPDGLAGEEIPIHARIICVADSFDAIISKRYYHEAKGIEEGLKEIERCSGTQFDPKIAACFVALMRQSSEARAKAEENIAAVAALEEARTP